MSKKKVDKAVPYSLPKKWVCSAIMLLAFVFYGNSVKNGYAIDDELVTTTDRMRHENVEKGVAGIKDIFTSRYAQDGKQQYSYRPITTLTFAIEWQFFKGSENRAGISHFINILIYGVCGILLYLFLLQLFKGEGQWFSFFVVMLFMIHPAHSEVVNNIKGRDELLAFAFALLAAINAFKYYDSMKPMYIYSSFLFMLLSALSKQSALSFFVIIPFSLFFFRSLKNTRLLTLFGGYVICISIFRFVKSSIVNQQELRIYEFFENPLFEMTFLDRIPMFFYSVFWYIQKLINPSELAYYYGYNQVEIITFSDGLFYLSFFVLILLGFIALRGFRNRSVLSYGIFFFFLAIGGAANLLGPIVGIVAERFAFIASVGFVLAIAYLFFKFLKMDYLKAGISNNKRYTFLFLLVIGIPSLVLSINRNKDWYSKKSLYLADIEKLTESVKANSLLASEYYTEAFVMQKEGSEFTEYDVIQRKADSALFYFEKAVSIYPNYASSLNNLAALHYTFKHDYNQAIMLGKRCVEIDSIYMEGLYNLANAYGKKAEMQRELANQIQANKNEIDPESHFVSYTYVVEINDMEEVTRAMSFFKALMAKYRPYATQQLNQQQKDMFIRLAYNYERIEGKFLKNSRFSDMFKNAVQSGNLDDLQYFFDTMNQSLIAYLDKGKDTDRLKRLLGSYLRANKDTAFYYFEKLYLVSPIYLPLYNATTTLATQLEDNTNLIMWNTRFVKSFPNVNHAQNYVQMANAYNSIGYSDSTNYYFERALNSMEIELSEKSTRQSLSNEEINRINQLKQEQMNLYNYLYKMNLQKGDTVKALEYFSKLY
ncbi:MAG: hypothetical protein ACK4K0_12030 [Flavobacteriales bacterium]